MSFVPFYMQTTGDNTNSGSTNSDTPLASSTNGDWGNAAANRFTASAGTPFSSATAGMWGSIMVDGATSTPYVAEIAAVNGGGASLDFSTTNVIGTPPATGASGRTCNVGGAWAGGPVITSAFTPQTLAFSFLGNIKAGTYANTSTTRAFAASGSNSTGVTILWRGYRDTPGDMDDVYDAVPGTDIPLFTFSTVPFAASGSVQKFKRIAITSASANHALTVPGGGVEFFGCEISNTNAASGSFAALVSGSGVNMTSCKLTATTTASRVVSLAANSFSLVGSTLHGGGSQVQFGANSLSSVWFVKNIFDNPGADAVAISSGSTCAVIDCTVYSPTGHGVSLVSTVGNVLVVNCQFVDVNQSAKAAIYNGSGTDTQLVRSIGNRYWNCTLNTDGLIEDYEIAPAITLPTTPLVNPAGGDFSVGESGKGQGFPGEFTGVRAYRSHREAGAVQRQEPTSYRGRKGTR